MEDIIIIGIIVVLMVAGIRSSVKIRCMLTRCAIFFCMIDMEAYVCHTIS